MKIIDWSLRQPQALAAVVLLVAIWGILAYVRTPVDLFPDTAPPQAVVVATQPGASARDMASDVAQVLEKELNTLDGVENITSTSRDGVSSINLEFGYRKTLTEAVGAVGNALDRVTGDLPAGMARPRVYAVSEATSPVMTLALRPAADSPKDLADIRLLAANPIQDRLLALPEVGGTITDLENNLGRMATALLPGFGMLALLLFALFGTLRHPLAVLTMVPLAVAGALWGLLIFGKPMCLPAIMGMILLGGTIVNNAILLLDFVNQAMAEGTPRDQAIVEALRPRTRPVLMTTVSTVLGLSPLIFELAVGLERMTPLAAAAGLLVGTVLTLLVLPALFSVLDDIAGILKRQFGSENTVEKGLRIVQRILRKFFAGKRATLDRCGLAVAHSTVWTIPQSEYC